MTAIDPEQADAFYRAGFHNGGNVARAELQRELDRLNAENDRLWFELRNPEVLAQRMREHLTAFDVRQHRRETACRLAEMNAAEAEAIARARALLAEGADPLDIAVDTGLLLTFVESIEEGRA